MYNQSPRDIGSVAAITPAVKYLLIVNIAVFAIEQLFHMPLKDWFELPSEWYRSFGFTKLFTYMFAHQDMNHIFSNMLGLFFIGPTVERALGSYRFFILYYISGILGGLGWSLLAPHGTACVGASGAVMGILGAFGALYPQAQLLLWFVLPVRAWVLVLVLGLWELHETVDPLIGGIANAAHLGGGVAGFCYALALKRPHWLADLKSRFSGAAKEQPSFRQRKAPPPQDRLTPEEIDRILDKIGKEGMGALTPREREMLKKATR